MSQIKAIETRYKGYRFRSRLEARWAVFFDALGIRWEYEPQGFVLSDGSPYLPDFHLPTFDGGVYVEVKPDGGDFSLALLFAKDLAVSVWLAEGTPSERAWNVAEPANPFSSDLPTPGFSGPWLCPGIPNADRAEGDNRMYVQPGYENKDLTIPKQYWDCLGSTFLSAVAAARSARFEHGEKP